MAKVKAKLHSSIEERDLLKLRIGLFNSFSSLYS